MAKHPTPPRSLPSPGDSANSSAGTDKTQPSRRLTKHLECVLSEEEVRLKGRELAELDVKLSGVEEAKRESNRAFNEEIKGYRKQMGNLDQEIISGIETRAVDCEELLVIDTNTVRTTRLDTMIIIDERPMTDQERQAEMNL